MPNIAAGGLFLTSLNDISKSADSLKIDYILKDRKESNSELLRYAGMGMQFLASIALGIFLGLKADKWLNFSFPLLVWMLPLLMIIGLTIKIIKDTSKK